MNEPIVQYTKEGKRGKMGLTPWNKNKNKNFIIKSPKNISYSYLQQEIIRILIKSDIWLTTKELATMLNLFGTDDIYKLLQPLVDSCLVSKRERKHPKKLKGNNKRIEYNILQVGVD